MRKGVTHPSLRETWGTGLWSLERRISFFPAPLLASRRFARCHTYSSPGLASWLCLNCISSGHPCACSTARSLRCFLLARSFSGFSQFRCAWVYRPIKFVRYIVSSLAAEQAHTKQLFQERSENWNTTKILWSRRNLPDPLSQFLTCNSPIRLQTQIASFFCKRQI